MTHRVLIKPNDLELIVEDNESVLSAALRQGFVFPHMCRNAMCGTCKGKLLAGHLDYGGRALPALNALEQEAGFALFCQAKPTSDSVIEITGVRAPGDFPILTLNCEVENITPVGPDLTLLRLHMPPMKHMRYLAGQYLHVITQDGQKYPYSIANAPIQPGVIELHIRHNEAHAFAEAILAEAKHKKMLTVEGPYGQCFLKPNSTKPILFLAGGTGFAPHKAIIEDALAKSSNRTMVLYWGVRHPEDIYSDLPERWAKHVPNFSFIPVVSEASITEDWDGRVGLVHDSVLQDREDFSGFEVYASGPFPMVMAALDDFTSRGLPAKDFYSDMLEE